MGEVVAVANTETGRDRIYTICTVHHGHPERGGEIQVVVPCPACRGRLIQFSPNALVIMPFGDKLIKAPVEMLYPVPYRPEATRRKTSRN